MKLAIVYMNALFKPYYIYYLKKSTNHQYVCLEFQHT